MSEDACYIGLMSGTSLDGIDAAVLDFSRSGNAVKAAITHPYPTSLSARLEMATTSTNLPVEELMRLDRDVADCFSEAVQTLLDSCQLRAAAIGSHGHTLRHLVEDGQVMTWQIGDPNRLAANCGLPVVADFRRRDTAEGGQGAPLVPAFHAAAFRHSDEDRVVLNLGGMANITILPADGAKPITGFDTGPGNILLNEWARRHLGVPMDEDGAWGKQGCVVPELLQALRKDPFFSLLPPKSTGRETFNGQWLDRHRPGQFAPADVQATLTALTARTVADAIQRHAPSTERLLICGGGVHNRTLSRELSAALPGLAIDSSAAHGLDPDWVEAAAFAWLARERLASRPANEPEVTGARRRAILGGVYAP